MGRSITIHCLGHSRERQDRSRRIFCAMSRLEIMQETEKAKREGIEIEYWTSQTKTGDRILGWNDDLLFNGYVNAECIPKARNVVVCEVCKGVGCVICNRSGITYKGHYKHWQDWQIDNIKNQLFNNKGEV